MTNVNGDLTLERVPRFGLAYEFDGIEKLAQAWLAVARYDHAVTRVPARAPEEVGLVTANSRGQASSASEEIYRTGLAVIL